MYTNTTGQLTSSHDGFKLFRQTWLPPGPPKRVLVIQHGLGEHSGRYGNVLQAFERSETAVFALDARGHGRSEGKRGHVDQFQLYIDDLADLVGVARAETGFSKVFLLGHSLGGVIALQYALQGTNQENLVGLAISSAGLVPCMDMTKRIKKFVGTLLASVAPATTVEAGLDLNFLSHDKEVIKAYKADPLVHGKVSFQMATNLFSLGEVIYGKAALLRIPTYVFHGTEDGIVDPAGSQRLFDGLTMRDKTLKLFQGLYHETMNEASPHKEEVLADLKSWILKRSS